MKKKRFSKNNLAFNIISAVLVLILIFSVAVGLIGYNTFTDNANYIYGDKANEVASEAMTKIHVNHIERYLKNGKSDKEWLECNRQLQVLCDNMADMIYVICVDGSDYSSYTTVFYAVNKDNATQVPLTLGQKGEISNDSFKKEFKALYTDDNIGSTTLLGAENSITAIHPLKDDSGNIAALLCVQLPMTNLGYRANFLVKIAVSALALIILAIIIFARHIRRQVVSPIRRVSEETNRFARENKQGEKLGTVSKIEEIATLSESIDKMEEKMLEYIENLTAATAEKERNAAELSIAAKIQQNAVPHHFPAFPERKEFEIFASMTPAKEVGGDFYNFFMIDDNRLALVMADVSGKGVPAALFMMVTNSLIKQRAQMGGTPAEILGIVNDSVCQSNEANMFVTVWLGILEISTGKITAANAGHEDPAVYRAEGGFELFKSKHDIALGVMEAFPYRDYEIELNKGDKIFLFTDGVPEATDKNEKMFTLDAMLEALNKHKDLPPKGILDGVNHCVKEFVGDAPQFDDVTMLCLELGEVTQ